MTILDVVKIDDGWHLFDFDDFCVFLSSYGNLFTQNCYNSFVVLHFNYNTMDNVCVVVYKVSFTCKDIFILRAIVIVIVW